LRFDVQYPGEVFKRKERNSRIGRAFVVVARLAFLAVGEQNDAGEREDAGSDIPARFKEG
jgi:hypothetical protein